jgi:hypothetical protein
VRFSILIPTYERRKTVVRTVAAPARRTLRDFGYRAGQAGLRLVSDDPYTLPRVAILAADGPRLVRLKVRTANWPASIRERMLRLVGSRP